MNGENKKEAIVHVQIEIIISINLACAFYSNYQGGYRIPHHHNTVQFEGYEDGLRKEDVVCIADYHKDLKIK